MPGGEIWEQSLKEQGKGDSGKMHKLPSCICRFSPHYRQLWRAELRGVTGRKFQLDQEAELANHTTDFLVRWGVPPYGASPTNSQDPPQKTDSIGLGWQRNPGLTSFQVTVWGLTLCRILPAWEGRVLDEI